MTATPEGRPFWLLGQDCPFWCSKPHHNCDVGIERNHASDGGTVHLSMHEGWGHMSEPQPVHVTLAQAPRDAEPYVEVWLLPKDVAINLDLGEAETLVRLLQDAIRDGQKSYNAQYGRDT